METAEIAKRYQLQVFHSAVGRTGTEAQRHKEILPAVRRVRVLVVNLRVLCVLCGEFFLLGTVRLYAINPFFTHRGGEVSRFRSQNLRILLRFRSFRELKPET